MAEVRLDSMLREFAVPTRTEVKAADVRSLLDELETKYPRLRRRIRDETGAVRRFVRVFVNGEAIDPTNGLATPLTERDRVDILHSIQGG
jgi:molybdopterin synthase sulfur carrier subunit